MAYTQKSEDLKNTMRGMADNSNYGNGNGNGDGDDKKKGKSNTTVTTEKVVKDGVSGIETTTTTTNISKADEPRKKTTNPYKGSAESYLKSLSKTSKHVGKSGEQMAKEGIISKAYADKWNEMTGWSPTTVTKTFKPDEEAVKITPKKAVTGNQLLKPAGVTSSITTSKEVTDGGNYGKNNLNTKTGLSYTNTNIGENITEEIKKEGGFDSKKSSGTIINKGKGRKDKIQKSPYKAKYLGKSGFFKSRKIDRKAKKNIHGFNKR